LLRRRTGRAQRAASSGNWVLGADICGVGGRWRARRIHLQGRAHRVGCIMTTVRFEKNNGPALAAIVAAGLGVLVLGLCTLLAEMSTATNNALNWWPPAGPLVGKTGVAVIAWLVLGVALPLALRRRAFSCR